MPTGYTAKVEDGLSFYEYALNCSRAFGALIEMRDLPADAEIPDEFKPSEYHLEQLMQASLELKKYMAMRSSEAATAAKVLFETECRDRENVIRKRKELKRKYEVLLAQAKDYEAPTPDHVEYKNFMISQLEKSIEADCDLGYYKRTEPVLKTGEEYRKLMVDMALNSIKRHSEGYQKEIENCARRTAWVKAMKKSLAPYKAGKVVIKDPNTISLQHVNSGRSFKVEIEENENFDTGSNGGAIEESKRSRLSITGKTDG